jgi:N-methylhydantoinase A
MPAGRAGDYAVRTLLSGPAAGTVAAAAFGAAAGLPDVISCDMGGTSFDVALIPSGRPAIADETSIEYGIPIKLPMVDIKTIGAGGGSIARVDRAGILRVGPDSAGSTPGPACYRRGGTLPTVTDANLVLGRIAADQRLGTERDFTLDRRAAAAAIEEHVGRPLGLDMTAAALAVIRVANELMANAIRMVSVDKGHDPRRFALVGFGGAGPLHIVELARAIGATEVIVPPHPGALSAFGCLLADVKYDFVTSIAANVQDCAADRVGEVLGGQRRAGEDMLAADGFDAPARSVAHIAEMSYTKQLYSIRVPLGTEEQGWTPERLADAFTRRYQETYGGRTPSGHIKLVSLRTEVTGRRDGIRLVGAEPGGPAAEPTERTVVFGDGPRTVPVLDRAALRPFEVVEGPAVVHQADSTTLLPPDTVALVKDNGSLVVAVAEKAVQV